MESVRANSARRGNEDDIRNSNGIERGEVEDGNQGKEKRYSYVKFARMKHSNTVHFALHVTTQWLFNARVKILLSPFLTNPQLLHQSTNYSLCIFRFSFVIHDPLSLFQSYGRPRTRARKWRCRHPRQEGCEDRDTKQAQAREGM